MKKITLLTFVLICSFYACNSSGQARHQEGKAQLEETIQALHTQIIAQKDVTKEAEAAKELVAKSQLFAKQFPQDSMTATYLFRAADVSRGLGDYTLAIDLWGKVNSEYSNFKRAPDALFLQGFTYDKDLKNAAQAKLHYQQFLKKYPAHPFSKDVSLMLQYLDNDNPPEELIREFKEKSGEK